MYKHTPLGSAILQLALTPTSAGARLAPNLHRSSAHPIDTLTKIDSMNNQLIAVGLRSLFRPFFIDSSAFTLVVIAYGACSSCCKCSTQLEQLVSQRWRHRGPLKGLTGPAFLRRGAIGRWPRRRARCPMETVGFGGSLFFDEVSLHLCWIHCVRYVWVANFTLTRTLVPLSWVMGLIMCILFCTFHVFLTFF